MSTDGPLDIFLVTSPGFERVLFQEARAKGFASARYEPGGVTLKGTWQDVWRANLELRGAGRVLVTLGSFRAEHLSQLEKTACRFPWSDTLKADVPVRVEASCKSSRVYHSGAAAERIARAIHRETGAPISPEAAVVIRARFENDVCTIGIDTSGELLHKRGHKEAVNKAPMRETFASLFLRECGFDGTEPVVDPMCGSGTFVIEAAEIAAGLKPGRSRRFAFEHFATFDREVWQAMRGERDLVTPPHKFYGSDRDAGAIAMSRENAERAGVGHLTVFQNHAISDLVAPEGPPGLVIVNPPYGDRIGEKQRLHGLYRALGETLLTRFKGWRAGVITSDTALANATRLPFLPTGPAVLHGGTRVTLSQTCPL